MTCLPASRFTIWDYDLGFRPSGPRTARQPRLPDRKSKKIILTLPENFTMLAIGKAVISRDLISSNFNCNLEACKGACCVAGDSGAPLEEEETAILEEIFPAIKCYLSEESVSTIETCGTWVIDVENDKVTPLNSGQECAYVFFENGIALCAIEKAYNDGVINFRKPLSCHLYPVRIKKYRYSDAVNYDRWEICKPAITRGDELNTPVYLFTRDALERKYGKDWFKELIAQAKL